MADKLIKLTEDEMGKMRRVELRQTAVAYGMSHADCSEAPSKKLIEFILNAQSGKVPSKKETAESKPARGRRSAESKEEAPSRRKTSKDEDEDEDEEEPDVDEDDEKDEPAPTPRGRRGRVEETVEEKAPARGAGRGRRSAESEAEVTKPEGGTSEILKRLDAIGGIQDGVRDLIVAQAKRIFVLGGLVQEVLLELKLPNKDIDSLIEDLESDFDKGNV